MTFVDTHAHLYLEHFDTDRDDVLMRAKAAGVEHILLPNIDSGSIAPLKALCRQNEGSCIPLMGLHPTSVKENYKEELKLVENELGSAKWYGIGETGIDLYWDKTFAREQELAFRTQLDLALHYNLPVVIHARESFNVIFKILNDYKGKGLTGVFHAFTGTLEQARVVTNDYGFCLGVGGIVTFKNSGLGQVITGVGADFLLLESDSPYLAPVPHRGKRNESAWVVHSAQIISKAANMVLEEVADITTRNAQALFKL